jgi:hypothetical protein
MVAILAAVTRALSLFEGFDGKNRRQVTCNLLPGLTFVKTPED